VSGEHVEEPCLALTFLGFCLAICEVEPFIGIPKGKDEGEMHWIAKDWDLDQPFFEVIKKRKMGNSCDTKVRSIRSSTISTVRSRRNSAQGA